MYIGEEENKILPDWNRRRKFLEFHKILKDKNCLKINLQSNSIPFCYPYLASSIKEADNFVKSHNELTIYRYWNELPKTFNEYKFYSRLVPIPLKND